MKPGRGCRGLQTPVGGQLLRGLPGHWEGPVSGLEGATEWVSDPCLCWGGGTFGGRGDAPPRELRGSRGPPAECQAEGWSPDSGGSPGAISVGPPFSVTTRGSPHPWGLPALSPHCHQPSPSQLPPSTFGRHSCSCSCPWLLRPGGRRQEAGRQAGSPGCEARAPEPSKALTVVLLT